MIILVVSTTVYQTYGPGETIASYWTSLLSSILSIASSLRMELAITKHGSKGVAHVDYINGGALVDYFQASFRQYISYRVAILMSRSALKKVELKPIFTLLTFL